MPTDFNDLAYFGITNVQMNEKCWNQGVTFSSRTIFHFEQCDMLGLVTKRSRVRIPAGAPFFIIEDILQCCICL